MICQHHHQCFILTRFSMNVHFTKLIPSKCIKTHPLLIWAWQTTIMSSLSRFGQNWFADFFLNISIPMSSGVRSPSSPFKPSDAANRSHDLPPAERRWLLSICVCICTFLQYCIIFSYMLSLYFDFCLLCKHLQCFCHLMMRRDGNHICGWARNFNGLLTSVAGSSERWSSQLCVPHAIEITNQKLVGKYVRKLIWTKHRLTHNESKINLCWKWFLNCYSKLATNHRLRQRVVFGE